MKRILILSAVGLVAASAAPIRAQTAGGWPYGLGSAAAVAQCDLDGADKPVNCRLTFEEPANSGLGDYVMVRANQGWDFDRLLSPPGKLVVAETQGEPQSNAKQPDLSERRGLPKPPPPPKAIGGAVVRCTGRADRSLDCKVVDEWPAKNPDIEAAALAQATRDEVTPGRTLTAPIYREYNHSGDHTVARAKWAIPPDAVALKATAPIEAMRQGISGTVLLRCHIDAQGLVKQCWVSQEKPTGHGFGQAALSYSRTFRFKPATIDGKPYAATVTVPIHYGSDGDGGYADAMSAMVSHPNWLQAPSLEQVKAAWPASRKEASFLVNLRCVVQPAGRLTNCDPIPKPPTVGAFLTAARKLAAQFQTAPLADPKRRTMIDLPVRLVPPGAAPGEPMTQLDWRASPTADDYAAAIKGLSLTDPKAIAIVNCLIGPAGALTDCQAVAQSDEGVAAALLPLTTRFRAELWSKDGRPTVGERVNLSLGP